MTYPELSFIPNHLFTIKSIQIAKRRPNNSDGQRFALPYDLAGAVECSPFRFPHGLMTEMITMDTMAKMLKNPATNNWLRRMMNS